MKGLLHSMIIFHNITPVILYIPVSQNIKGPKEKGERVQNWLWF